MLYLERLEGNLALCEDENGARVTLERAQLPPLAREGDALLADETGTLWIDAARTAARRKAMFEKMRQLAKEPR